MLQNQIMQRETKMLHLKTMEPLLTAFKKLMVHKLTMQNT